MRRLRRRQLIWVALFSVAIAVLLLLLVLVGIGYLRLPTTAGPTYTVTEVKWTILQGNNPENEAWFGRGVFNYTGATGWSEAPHPAGSTFLVTWTITNYDNVNRTIYSVTVNSPFLVAGTGRPLPMNVAVGDEGNPLVITISTTSGTSGTYVLSITVNAIS
jgi:hypothetical protein